MGRKVVRRLEEMPEKGDGKDRQRERVKEMVSRKRARGGGQVGRVPCREVRGDEA